jgi:ribosomal protein S14
MIQHPRVPLVNRYFASYRRVLMPRNAAIGKMVNRCLESGRKYSTIHKVKLSRFAFRIEAYNGSLPGVRRHS